MYEGVLVIVSEYCEVLIHVLKMEVPMVKGTSIFGYSGNSFTKHSAKCNFIACIPIVNENAYYSLYKM